MCGQNPAPVYIHSPPLAPEFNIEIHGMDYIIMDFIMFALLDYWPQSILNMGVKGGGEVVRDFVHPPSGDAADSSDVGSSPRGCAEIIEKRLPQAEASDCPARWRRASASAAAALTAL